MKKPEIAKRLAKQSNISAAAAADQVDSVVSEILRRVRKGKPASLPGLGTFTRDENGLKFDQEQRHAKGDGH
jgi:nucleoid DNA-binding protein